MELPSEILFLIFEAAGLHKLDGLEDRCRCSQVCRQWHQTLSQPTFWQAGAVPVGRFDTLDQLDSYLRRFRARHPRLRELQWAGHLHNMHSYRSEEHMVQPLLLSHCDQLRILRLTDCSVAATSIAAVGAACPLLEEIRFRGASPSYSAERVSARSELLRHADMMSIVHGCKRLHILDVVACGCSPFAVRFQPDLLEAVVEGLPLLEELTLFGDLQGIWGRLGCLEDATDLTTLNLFGLDNLNKQVPYLLPPFSHSITKLILEEYRLDAKAPTTLANALPNLREIDVPVLCGSQLLMRSLAGENAPMHARGMIYQFQEDLEKSRLEELEALALYFSMPFGGPQRIAMNIRQLDLGEALRRVDMMKEWQGVKEWHAAPRGIGSGCTFL